MTHPPIQLSTRIAHDFRTPLTVIKEYASIIRDGIVGEVNAEQSRMLNVIDDRADDIYLLVDNLLFLSQADANPLLNDRRRVDLSQLIGDVFLQMAPRCRLQGCEIVLSEHDADSNDCYCDDQRLSHALRNIVSFAVKHRGGAEQIQVQLEPDGVGNNLLVSLPVVLDSDAESLEELRPVDLGVGLDVAEQLVRLSFGKLEIKRDPGSDDSTETRIEFSIPRFERDDVVRRYVDWFSGSPTAIEAEIFLLEDPQHESSSGRPTRLESTLRYVLEASELLVEYGESSWLVVSPRCINRTDLLARIGELNSELGRECDMNLARHKAPMNQGARVVLAAVEELTESFLAI